MLDCPKELSSYFQNHVQYSIVSCLSEHWCHVCCNTSHEQQYVPNSYGLICIVPSPLTVCTSCFITLSLLHSVVLYNCGGLSGDDCSGCLGLSADYNCGYCQPDCNLNSLTCAGSCLIQAPDFEQCGDFTVIKVHTV